MNFKDRILTTIKDQQVTPTPRWRFLLREYLVWVVVVLALVLGAIAAGLVVFVGANLQLVPTGALPHALLSNLFLWLGVFLLLATAAVWQFGRTARGYRYSLASVGGGALATGLVGGVVLFACGGMPAADQMAQEAVPGYTPLSEQARTYWLAPSEGRLVGVVVFSGPRQHFVLEDPSGGRWVVLMPTSSPADFGHYAYLTDARVRVRGVELPEQRFRACAAQAHRLQGDRPVWRSAGGHERTLASYRINECDP
ncbi:hypothetical protein GVX82_04950 [Patescibacteria group bacterium]|jgi:hypothetical protein|nr:hypothetical protein [Patescibacteria group bacterium]